MLVFQKGVPKTNSLMCNKMCIGTQQILLLVPKDYSNFKQDKQDRLKAFVILFKTIT